MDASEVVPLGRTSVSVTRLGLGLASIGGLFTPVPKEQAVATIERAWDLGVRLFDTAPVYGYGRSETYAGLVLRSKPRHEFVLSTKVGRLLVPGGTDTQEIWADPPPGVGPKNDYSYAAVRQSIEDSLERLGLDRIDVLHVHDPEQDFPLAVGEAYYALADLRATGRIGAVSIGVNHADVAARYLREVEEPGLDAVLLAGRYSLLDQSGLDDLLPLCGERGVAVIAAGVFQGGILTSADAPPAATAWQRLCESFDVPLAAAAIQFPFTHPAVASVLVGARHPDEVEASVQGLATEVSDELWREAERVGLTPARAPKP
ncbi:aldo/keto reductase [Tenggerimyces flavus]|uniref:Aldo/keto reductase n=1 Tax=Tenggerimyces flavus TaxID=1708749 RepID=A0ABV7Y4L2_9ACTN|nr:aldo/keto reductase [Tenggerimyces flavus]MBM7790611.1 D-threo-aldose 1-dehydrogenase [Tenggerimyces flavus]